MNDILVQKQVITTNQYNKKSINTKTLQQIQKIDDSMHTAKRSKK